MQLARSGIALDPRLFGRGGTQVTSIAPTTASSDLRLFATTFAAGFLFVSVFIA